MFFYPPANTFGDPAETDVQVGSPIRPQSSPLIFTVLEPDEIGAVCDGQGPPGNL